MCVCVIGACDWSFVTHLPVCRFLIGREKPGEQSEVAQLIQQTLEQERWQREMMEQRYENYMGDEDEVCVCVCVCMHVQ